MIGAEIKKCGRPDTPTELVDIKLVTRRVNVCATGCKKHPRGAYVSFDENGKVVSCGLSIPELPTDRQENTVTS